MIFKAGFMYKYKILKSNKLRLISLLVRSDWNGYKLEGRLRFPSSSLLFERIIDGKPEVINRLSTILIANRTILVNPVK